MSVATTRRTEEDIQTSVRILSELFNAEALRKLRIQLWDGTYWPNADPRPVTLIIRHPGSLRSMFLPGTEVGLGEAYIYDDFDINGDIEQLFGVVDFFEKASKRE